MPYVGELKGHKRLRPHARKVNTMRRIAKYLRSSIRVLTTEGMACSKPAAWQPVSYLYLPYPSTQETDDQRCGILKFCAKPKQMPRANVHRMYRIYLFVRPKNK